MKRILTLCVVLGALALTATSALARTEHSTGWQANVWRSPSGNIACRYYPTLDTVTCQTDNDHFALAVRRYGGSGFQTYYRWIPAWAYTLDYGATWTAPGFSCTSHTYGMT